MKPKQFNAMSASAKWRIWDDRFPKLEGQPKWYCPRCNHQIDNPHRAQPFSGASVHCSYCDFELTKRTGGGQGDPFGWHLGKVHPPKLDELPNGTVIRRGKRIYSIQQGLGQRLVVDVDTGFWLFMENLNWKSYEVAYKPYKCVSKL